MLIDVNFGAELRDFFNFFSRAAPKPFACRQRGGLYCETHTWEQPDSTISQKHRPEGALPEMSEGL